MSTILKGPNPLSTTLDHIKPSVNDVANSRGLYLQHPLYHGLRGLWLFNEGGGNTVRDYSGYGNDGTLTGMDPLTDWVIGPDGYVLDFDGTGDYIDCGDVLTITGELTLMCWAMSTSLTTSPPDCLISRANGGSRADYSLHMSSDGVSFIYDLSTGGDVEVEISTTNTANVWYQFACTVVGTDLTVFRDGVQLGTGTVTLSDNVSTGLTFGAFDDGTKYELSGQISQVLIYDRALSGSEVQALFQRPYAPFEWAARARRRTFFVPAGGGVTETIELAGSTTPAGAIVLEAQNILAGSTTPAGALVFEAQQILAGSATPAGALATVKVAVVALAGTITPAGALVLTGVKALAATVTPAGALVFRALKVLAGATTPAGVPAHQANISLSGSTTPSGVLTPVKVAVIALAGTITPAGAVVLTAVKVVAATVTPAGAVVFRAAKVLAGTITPAGTVTLVKLFQIALAGALTITGTVANVFVPGAGVTFRDYIVSLRRRRK